MSTQQNLQQEVARLTAALVERDRELVSLRTRLTLDESGGRAPIVRVESKENGVDDQETFHEALHGLALVSRLRIGAHQAAISYVPDGTSRLPSTPIPFPRSMPDTTLTT